MTKITLRDEGKRFALWANLSKSYVTAVQAALEICAKQHNLFGVHVARLDYGDFHPTGNRPFSPCYGMKNLMLSGFSAAS
jgi:hypothetical protein